MFGVHEHESALRDVRRAGNGVFSGAVRRYDTIKAVDPAVRFDDIGALREQLRPRFRRAAPRGGPIHRERLPAMTVVVRAALTDQPIRLAEHQELVSHQAAGAVVGFVGMIRDHDNGRQVMKLEYSAHPSAANVIADVVAEVAAESPETRAVAASHRIGVLQIGEAALVVAVAADHRQAAFATCAQLVDAIKARLPVWKHQFFADGTEEWVGST
jgi:molybdopterin synthase catalytic subunit